MPHDPHLAERMRSALQERAGITEKNMFGGYCWTLNGNMLCGVEVGRFMFRVGKEMESAALKRRGPRRWTSRASPCAASCGSMQITRAAKYCVTGSRSPRNLLVRCRRSSRLQHFETAREQLLHSVGRSCAKGALAMLCS